MESFEDIEHIRTVYFGEGSELLNDFLIPVLHKATSYDRITSYFTVDSLLAISHGLENLFAKNGRMRLIVGIHDFPPELAEAVKQEDYLQSQIAKIRSELCEGMASLSDELERKRLATVAWMIQDGLLEVKAACMPYEKKGIFHPKTLIMHDEVGNTIAASGSPNETGSGLGDNFEQLVVIKSWIDSEGVHDLENVFNQLWQNRFDGVFIYDLTKDLASDILSSLGNSASREKQTNLALAPVDSETARNMPSLFFVSGVIPALFHHQERAVLDALSRWPVRVLFADEVGLGKTFEVASVIAYMKKFAGVDRVLILPPKSVMWQWQDELSTHFGINAWVYESAKHQFVSPKGELKPLKDRSPIGKDCPDIAIISAQYARGSSGRSDIFSESGSILPNLLVVDEAHSARVSKDISGKRKATLMHKMLKEHVGDIPHVVFATATPMQKDSEEYYSLLSLLGLPSGWSKEKAHRLADLLVVSEDPPELSEAHSAARMLLSTWKEMHPSEYLLDTTEIDLLSHLDQSKSSFETGSIVQSNWPVFKQLFIKLHPARLLTVRNSRRSLEKVGYTFPSRLLHAVTLDGEDQIESFYLKVDNYLKTSYFEVEKVLYPNKQFSDGFVKSGYQQRLASSLHSCLQSLSNRKDKLLSMKASFDRQAIDYPSDRDEFDSIDEDDALLNGVDEDFSYKEESVIDFKQASHAVDLELSALSPLIGILTDLIESRGDPKIDRSIEQAVSCLSSGDKVLVFSRFTDTIDALLDAYCKSDYAESPYGIYTGSISEAWLAGSKSKVSKERLKELLAAGNIKIVFCSDAASEGLNLQAARVLINVDVPWTPARLEQRIGRVARLGQTASTVDIYNVWYPQSVEAKMYGRIQQRLKQYGLTIGEFPDVVAESIRNSVTDGTVDESFELLQKMRSSMQERALKTLWDNNSAGDTLSQTFRRNLIELIKKKYEFEDTGHESYKFHLPSGTESITIAVGDDNTISLSKRVWSLANIPLPGYRLLKDVAGNPSAYQPFGAEHAYLLPENLPQALSSTSAEQLCSETRPRWIPDFSAISLAYCCPGLTTAPPKIWPPISSSSINQVGDN